MWFTVFVNGPWSCCFLDSKVIHIYNQKQRYICETFFHEVVGESNAFEETGENKIKNV